MLRKKTGAYPSHITVSGEGSELWVWIGAVCVVLIVVTAVHSVMTAMA
jgi:hypothetical protein